VDAGSFRTRLGFRLHRSGWRRATFLDVGADRPRYFAPYL